VGISADGWRAAREKLLAMCIHKGTAVAAAEQVRHRDVLVYAA
jgi:hypothetical protein